MKKLTWIGLIFTILILPFCTTTKNAAGKNKKMASVHYDHDVAPILLSHCSPCHYPETGKKLPLNTYAAASTNVDAILYRVQLPHDDPKFMPFKMKKEPLSDSLINVIKLWKEEGLAESSSKQ